jgi:hypothetical protein
LTVKHNDSCVDNAEAEAEAEADKIKPSRAKTALEEDFDQFWAVYPKRVGKGAAWKAWQKQKPTRLDVLSAIQWQLKQPAWTKDAGQYIPHPSTWLNRRGWEDEPFHLPSAQERPDGPRETTSEYNARILAEGRAEAARAAVPRPPTPPIDGAVFLLEELLRSRGGSLPWVEAKREVPAVAKMLWPDDAEESYRNAAMFLAWREETIALQPDLFVLVKGELQFTNEAKELLHD